MEYTERPNLRAVEWLLTVLSADFVKLYRDNEADMTYSHVKKVLQSFLKHKEVKVSYFKSQHDTLGVLRSYSSGIQGLPKEFRGLLCSHMTDYDMVNCHPTILLNLCKKHHISHQFLDHFVASRNELYENKQTNKITIMVSMFSNKKPKFPSPFMLAFDAEMKLIQKELISLYPDLYDMAKTKNATEKKQNTDGTFISYVCQYHENQIINACVLHFKLDVAVLMFDGFMTYGNSVSVGELSSFVKERFDMDITFTIKEHNDTLKIPDNWTANNTDIIYEQLKAKYEHDYSLAYIEKSVSYSYKIRDEICFFSKEECSKHFDSVTVGTNQFFKLWCADKNKQVYHDVGMHPHDVACPDGVLNLWTGFAVEKNVKDIVDIQKILNHVHILANHDETVYSFLLDWMANLFQYPSSPSIFVGLCSVQEGTGKSALMEFLANMIGRDKYIEINDPEKQLFGTFNGHLTNAVLVNINEVKRGDMNQFYERLKSAINSPMNEVHDKGKKSYEIANIRHYFSTTNIPDAVVLKEGSRRYMMTYTSEELIGQQDYFDELFTQIASTSVQYSFYRFLMDRDVPKKFTQASIPVTDLMREAHVLNRDPIEDYIINFRNECTSDDLYIEYKDFIRDTGLKDPLSKKCFEMRFSRLMEKHGVEKKRIDKIVDGKRVQSVVYRRKLMIPE